MLTLPTFDTDRIMGEKTNYFLIYLQMEKILFDEWMNESYPNIMSTKTISESAKRVLTVLMTWSLHSSVLMTYSQLAITCRLSIAEIEDGIDELDNLGFIDVSDGDMFCKFRIVHDNINYYENTITEFSENENNVTVLVK